MFQHAITALQQTPGSTSLISTALGVIAGIKSGSQGGIADELPPCDLLLACTNQLVPNGTSGDNVIIGRSSAWMHLLLKSFYSRNMLFSYIIIDDRSLRHDRCHCPMSKAPSCEILPNMFYGLVEDYTDRDTKQLYKVVHRPECIPDLLIDGRAIEFLTAHLYKRLEGLTNVQAQGVVRAVIDEMCKAVMECREANFWDKRIVERIQKLLDDDTSHQEDKIIKNETIDRIYSRLPAMLERLHLDNYRVLLDGNREEFNISDTTRSFVIYFGISRAIRMSRKIFEENALVLMGYNILVGHDMVRDLSRLPARTQVGYSSRLRVENTTESRLIEEKVKDNRVYYGLIFEAALSTSFLMLTGIGPVLSMYVARLLTRPYRSSSLEMGTSLNWSVSDILLHYTGLARDDWMACITPAPQVQKKISLFKFFASMSTLAPVITWFFIHPNMQGSISTLGHAATGIDLLVCVPWILASWSLHVERRGEHHQLKQEQLSQKVFRWTLLVTSLLLLPILEKVNFQSNLTYLYMLELVYAIQWGYGVTRQEWLHQSTALFMLGILGSVRLSSVA